MAAARAREPEPTAARGDARTTPLAGALARRALAVPARPPPTGRAAAARLRARLGRGRGAVAVDDAGLRPADLHERRDAIRRAAAACARAERDGRLPADLRRAPRLALAIGRPALRRLGGLPVRARQRRAGGNREGRAHARGVRRERARTPRRRERAGRGGRPLVGRELRRGPGPVVARGAAAVDPPRFTERARPGGACLSRRPAGLGRSLRRRRAPARRARSRRRARVARRRPPRHGGARAAPLVGRGAEPVPARGRVGGRDGGDERRLPHGRGARPSAPRQRGAGADRGREST